MFGQFRSYKYNLKNNLDAIYNSLLLNNEVDVYILTDKKQTGNFSIENELEISNLLEEYGCKIIFVKYWEDLTDYHNEDKIKENKYNLECLNNRGKNKFTANLWYRRYILNKLKNEYVLSNNLKYDLNTYLRLFDTIIIKNVENKLVKNEIENCIDNNIILLSLDTIIIGNNTVFDYVFLLGEKFELYHDEIWNDKQFSNKLNNIDKVLFNGKYTYCSEIQLLAYIFYSNYDFKIIKAPHDNNMDKQYSNGFFKVRLCEKRNIFS